MTARGLAHDYIRKTVADKAKFILSSHFSIFPAGIHIIALCSGMENAALLNIYSAQVLKELEERNSHCPENDRLCQEAVWLPQNLLLGTRQDMDQIAEAIRKIQRQAELLVRS